MGKLAQATSKYCVHARFEADGVVEKPDVIGAVFGQTEGLLGNDMDLRELQKTGRIGRVDVTLESKDGKTVGTIDIPSSLDASETALIGATLETIERIGPCNTTIKIDKIEDVRANKRQYLLERAKELLSSTFDENSMESEEITEQLKESVRGSEIVEFQGLPAGPGIENSDTLIICEGRADVVKLLRNGIKNVIAIEGTSVPDAVVALSKQKECTAFLDGDRGGDLILKEMRSRGVNLDFVARAPEGKEVEELTKKEIFKSLREKVKLDEAKEISAPIRRPERTERPRRPMRSARETSAPARSFERQERAFSRPERPVFVRIDDEDKRLLKESFDKVSGSGSAYILDKKLEVLGKIPMANISSAMKDVEGARAVVLDGQIDQDLAFTASRLGVEFIVGTGVKEGMRRPRGTTVLTSENLGD